MPARTGRGEPVSRVRPVTDSFPTPTRRTAAESIYLINLNSHPARQQAGRIPVPRLEGYGRGDHPHAPARRTLSSVCLSTWTAVGRSPVGRSDASPAVSKFRCHPFFVLRRSVSRIVVSPSGRGGTGVHGVPVPDRDPTSVGSNRSPTVNPRRSLRLSLFERGGVQNRPYRCPSRLPSTPVPSRPPRTRDSSSRHPPPDR